MTIARTICGITLAMLLGQTATSAHAATKASRACRKVIASSFSKVATTEAAIVAACHKLRDKGKFSGDCNDLAQADVKGKIAKVQAAVTTTIGKKCVIGDPVLVNYLMANPENAFFPVAHDRVEVTGAALLGTPSLVGDKSKVKCHGAISKAAVKDLTAILKSATKCQASLDKLADTFVALAGDCVATPVKAGPSGEAAITKACGGVASADVGSCDPLPSCVTVTATGAGQTIAQA